MTQSTYPPAGTQPPYGHSYGPPAPGAPQFGAPLPPYGYPQQPPTKKRTGLIVGSVVAAVLLVGGLAVGAVLLLGAKTLDTADAQREIGRVTAELTGVTPTDVSCPGDIEVQAGGSFGCTASLEGQPVSFTVTQKDEDGNVEITPENTFVLLSTVEEQLSQGVGEETEVEVTSSCDAGGRTVLVDPAGTEIPCTVTNAADSSDSVDVVATVDGDGVSYRRA